MLAAGDQTAALRRFNRGYTRSLGLLQPGGMFPPLSLPEARIVYEIAQAPGVSATAIAAELEINKGYLSRLISSLVAEGYVSAEPDPADGRRRRLKLTAAGATLFDDMNRRSEQQAATLLAPLHPLDRRRALQGLKEAERLWAKPEPVPILLRDPEAGDLGWVIERNGAVYAAEYGWGWEIEAECAEIITRFVRHFDPKREKCFIADRSGERLGCIFLVKEDETTARIRLVLVEKHARGLGLGSRLVREALAFARSAGYRRVVLWTHAVLVDARRVYESAGFTLVESHEHNRFGPTITSQTWALDL